MAGARQADQPRASHLAIHREDEKIRFRDIQAQPRKIISSPTWSGIESETVSSNAGYTNVHELIPWRTFAGRPAVLSGSSVDTRLRPSPGLLPAAGRYLKATAAIHGRRPNGNPEILLNFITPHQKWGMRFTYTKGPT